MGVTDGQLVNASVTNAAFLDSNADDTASGKIGFHNTDPASGPNIDNIQKGFNNVAGTVGLDVSGNATAENDTTGKDYSSNNVVANGDTHKAAIGKVDAKFNSTTGHKHDGTAGNGPKISATDLSGTLPIASGGTGKTTQQAALDALAGSVSSGQYLRGNGTHVVMGAIQASDVPTLNQNTTGTASNVTGTVAIANGGTGQTTAGPAFDALAPTTTKGDLIVRNGTTNTRIAVGSDGQALVADSAQASGVKWSNVTFTSPLTTKGDIFTHNASADARLPVGTDGYALTADSTQTTGLKWSPMSTYTSPLTTKGDLLGHSTVDARVPVGTDGQVLTADSTKALGVAWKTATGGLYTSQNFTGTTLTLTADGFQRARFTDSTPQTLASFVVTSVIDAACIIILGTSDTNTISIPSSISGTKLNGDWLGGYGNTLSLQYDSALGLLIETGRT